MFYERILEDIDEAQPNYVAPMSEERSVEEESEPELELKTMPRSPVYGVAGPSRPPPSSGFRVAEERKRKARPVKVIKGRAESRGRRPWGRIAIAVAIVGLHAHVNAEHLPHAAMIDCSASSEIADMYLDWFRDGIHVITPNKKANTAPLATYRTMRALGSGTATQYLYEATVGAGLPVIKTLRDLLETGDRIHRIEGVLSGSLSFVTAGSPGVVRWCS